MAITIEQVKELRDATGISVMQCKKALEEAGGDMEKALLVLKKKSTEMAAKKSDREVGSGAIIPAHKDGFGLLLTLRCETDFVAKNSDFLALGETLAKTALESGKEVAEKIAPDLIGSAIQKIGENIQLGDVATVEAPIVGMYVHDGHFASLVGLNGGTETLAKDVAMHITAMHPEYATRADVPEDAIAKMRGVFEEEVKASGKPADIQEKMLNGKIDTFFKERTLLDQSFIKNPDMTVGKLIESAGAKLVKFVRVSVA